MIGFVVAHRLVVSGPCIGGLGSAGRRYYCGGTSRPRTKTDGA